jgi:hypothetical protein
MYRGYGFQTRAAHKPISAMSLSRPMQIQYRTCWHLLRRLRAMMTSSETMPLAAFSSR